MTPPTIPTARTLLADLRRAGVLLTAKGDRLAFDAPAGVMTADVRAALTTHKPEILAVLRGDYAGAAAALLASLPEPDRQDLGYHFDERAGIGEFDGGMSRGDAERQAYIELGRAVEAQDDAGAQET